MVTPTSRNTEPSFPAWPSPRKSSKEPFRWVSVGMPVLLSGFVYGLSLTPLFALIYHAPSFMVLSFLYRFVTGQSDGSNLT